MKDYLPILELLLGIVLLLIVDRLRSMKGGTMSFEFYVLACMILIAFGFGMLLQNLSSRIGEIEEKLNMEDGDEDQKDEATT